MSSIVPTEFHARYRRYTPEHSKQLMRIAEALGVIRGANVLPAVADELRASARVGTIHYSNLIEGNQLPVIEAERAARGQLDADTKARVELVNYVDALDLIDARLEQGTLDLSADFLLELHGVTTRGLGRDDDPHFKPHHEGRWRDGTARVVDRITGTVLHEGPPAREVESRMAGLFECVERFRRLGDPPFVLAGVVHYGITDVHPFADGNGRVARLFQCAALLHADVLPGRMFSFERYYAEDRAAYYGALRSVGRSTGNMEPWLDYFLRGLAEEYERVATTVAHLSALMPGGGGAPVRLTPGQERGLAKLQLEGRREFTRREYEAAADAARSTAGKELRALVDHGILTIRGAGPSTRYAFLGRPSTSTRSRDRRGRPRRWTDTAIERALREYVGDGAWPSPHEFKADGQYALYSAATKAGGIGRWRRLLGR